MARFGKVAKDHEEGVNKNFKVLAGQLLEIADNPDFGKDNYLTEVFTACLPMMNYSFDYDLTSLSDHTNLILLRGIV